MDLLAPLPVWYVGGLAGYVILDGHDRSVAAEATVRMEEHERTVTWFADTPDADWPIWGRIALQRCGRSGWRAILGITAV